MRPATILVVLFAAIFAVAPAFAAPVLTSPKALIAYAYQPYADGVFPEDPYELFAPDLKALVGADIAGAGEDGIGGLEFDPFIDAQDYQDVHAALHSLVQNWTFAKGNQAEAKVTVTNFGENIELVFTLVETGDGWLIDDIARVDGDNPWRLSELLGG